MCGILFFSFNTMAVLISPLAAEQIPEILSFIVPHEAECVNLVHEILNGAENCYIVQKDGAICGAFCFRARRTVFHCLPFTKYKTQQDKILCQETQAAFYEFFANEKPFCINGESTGSLFLKNILKNKPAPVMAKVVNEYWLLSVSRGSEQDTGAVSSEQSQGTGTTPCGLETSVPSMPDGLTTPTDLSNAMVFRATPDDTEKLFPLEKAYQYEEVIPPNFTVSDEMLASALKLNLQNQKIFALAAPSTSNSSDQALVAKAALTAMGQNFALVGGVYTLPEYRRKGYARVLVQHILQELAASKPNGLATTSGTLNASLYVKKSNAAAIALYKSLGFVQVGEYKLIYF